MIRYEVSKQINVSACLFLFEVAGSGPMQSMAHPAKGTFWMSESMGSVYNQLGRNWVHNWQLLMCWMYISVHPDPPEVAPYHVCCVADTLVSFTFVEF